MMGTNNYDAHKKNSFRHVIIDTVQRQIVGEHADPFESKANLFFH